MPTVTDEQIRRAKEVGILAYLRTHEPQSLRKSKGGNDEYYLAEHDSLKISNGKFHWFSRGIGGYSALDFLVKVRGMGFIDAVRRLTGDGIDYRAIPLPPLPKQAKPSKPFALPPANINNDRVYAYLRGRGIDRDIIKRCIDGGILYENTMGNCIFVGYDGSKPRFACERGTKDDYKKDISASDKRFSFVLPPKNPNSHNLMTCESPIDCLSHAGIHKLDGDRWDGFRLSLGGVGSVALISFLERNPQIENVRLSLDNDKAGRGATERMIKELLSEKRFSHMKISDAPPPIGNKDYNDTLQAILQLHKHKSRPDRSKEAVYFI
jgi:hypothetical protein